MGEESGENLEMFFKKVNSNMVKPEKFQHLHLVYHFTVPLSAQLKLNIN